MRSRTNPTDATRSQNVGRLDVTPSAWPTAAPTPSDPVLEARLESILSTLSDEDKVGQIIQADIGSVTPADLNRYPLGSILNGGNSAPGADLHAPASAWLALADAFWEASMQASGNQIPIIWGSDAIHGNSNVAGATIFPHAINLGAARDADLVERIGAATALEMAVTGLDWTFAPTLAVVQDVRWGRTFESFSADPEWVAKLGVALIRGLQGVRGTPEFLGAGKVAATAKHFVGDGGVRDGRDQGDTDASETELRDIHAAAYLPAMAAGVQSIMASFSSWGGRKMHGRADLLDGVLKQQWGFDGVVVGDWNGHGQLPGATPERCPDAVLAGLDMYMAPDSWSGLFRSTLDAVQSGAIPRARLDDAVRRVLRLKLRAGLFDKSKPSQRPFAGQFDLLACAQHLDLAREAVRKSAVLLKNQDGLLPLKTGQAILIAGDRANDLSCQCGGWTLSWQGQGLRRDDFPSSETIAEGVARVVEAGGGRVEHAPNGAWSQRPDAAIVVLGEEPYAEFRGDLETLDYKAGDRRDYEVLQKLRDDGVPTIVIFLSGRPLWVNPALNGCDAFVAAFLPGSQAGALADLLFQNADAEHRQDFRGRLPFAWPLNADRVEPDSVLFPLGFGLSLSDRATLPHLHERSAATGADPHTVFDVGIAQGGWTLSIADSAGEQAANGPAFHSPARAVSARAADLGKQENALSVTWSGDKGGTLVLRHPPLDLTRDANAGCCLAMHCAIPGSPKAAFHVRLRTTQGATDALKIDIESLHSDRDHAVAIEIPLKAFVAVGAALTCVEAIEFEADGPYEIVLAKLSISPTTPRGRAP